MQRVCGAALTNIHTVKEEKRAGQGHERTSGQERGDVLTRQTYTTITRNEHGLNSSLTTRTRLIASLSNTGGRGSPMDRIAVAPNGTGGLRTNQNKRRARRTTASGGVHDSPA